MCKVNIKADKKASARAITSTDNNADSSGKVTDQYTSLADFVFAALAAANCVGDFNLVVPEKIPSGATISTSDKFFTTFATLANTTLEKEPNMCKSNTFLFVANR